MKRQGVRDTPLIPPYFPSQPCGGRKARGIMNPLFHEHYRFPHDVVADVPQRSLIFFLLCGYMFLSIERPWEIWETLGEIRFERIYMIALIIFFTIWSHKQFKWHVLHYWIIGFLLLHFALAPFAFNGQGAVDQGFEYFKMVLFYFLIVSTINNKFELRYFVFAFILSMSVYMVHSLREFILGRHVFRMDITRMIGVDQTYGDPNAFSASVVFSLPFLLALWRTETRRLFQAGYLLYGALAAVCIVLTGSRAGFVCLSLFLVLSVWSLAAKKRFLWMGAVVLAMMLFLALIPEEKRTRIETLWNPEAGPTSAQASAEGRIEGLKSGLRMFLARPLTGVGAGKENFIGYRIHYDDGSPNQAHNLLGELLGEFGVLGGLVFLGQVAALVVTARSVQKLARVWPGEFDPFLAAVSTACIHTVLLLLASGFFGHNLYRPHWLWIAAWTILAENFAHAEAAYLMASEEVTGSSSGCAPDLVHEGCAPGLAG
jgi:O-antigen ligase